MKRLLYITLIAALVGSFSSCKDQDEIYKQWVVPGGSVYPEKANGLNAKVGYQRVQLKWAVPKDPAVQRAVITWDNGDKTKEINYSDFNSTDSICVELDQLKEQSYTFTVVNYDKDGNKSMQSENTASPYGELWLSTHAERTINSAEIASGTTANVTMGFGTNEMIATKFRYLDTEGNWVVTDPVPSAQSSTVFENAKVGSRYQYCSAYCPSEGLDTLWNDWLNGPTPIAGKLAHTNWSVEAPGYSSGYPPEYAIDGVITGNFSNGWWWNNATYPKIFLVDMGNNDTYINKIILYQNNTTWYNARTLNNVELYCGNEKFDINAGADYANTSAFQNALFKHTTMIFWNGTAYGTWNLGQMLNVRYFCFVIKNSRRNGSSINEIDAFGYDNSAE